jgi:thiamine-phosphate pyrophosphorylase
MRPNLPQSLSLYVILDPEHTLARDPLWVAERALEAGATCIQWRAKSLNDRQRFDIATRLRALTTKHGAALLINDRIDIALACDADGVHIGPDDLPPAVARRVLGDRRWLGVSAPSEQAARDAQDAGADYLGVGALYEARAVKPGASAPRGAAWLQHMHTVTHLPIVGIGGIDLPQISEVIAAGAAGVALIRAVCAAPDPFAATLALKRALLNARLSSAQPAQT